MFGVLQISKNIVCRNQSYLFSRALHLGRQEEKEKQREGDKGERRYLDVLCEVNTDINFVPLGRIADLCDERGRWAHKNDCKRGSKPSKTAISDFENRKFSYMYAMHISSARLFRLLNFKWWLAFKPFARHGSCLRANGPSIC
ncbi:hypothetical protein HNY73_018405 [Argiope bruennichi]|uniref:Uncharacterized protein n=1 Tax=Argiope bruennichi TaxID=94029 RepID=A0A8T0EDR7_ARGBR|nr:hypothetical protein HNY73_018405 [Argiope bruennichi]